MKKLIPLAVLLMLPCLQLLAQEGKLKTIQATSVWAPVNVKVDGSLKEWDDTFQAFNKTTKLFYTICNDDKYLYFIVKSIDVPTTDKIVGGGLTLNINTDDKKKDKDVYSITFPNIPRQTRGQGGGRGGAGGGGGGRGGGGFGGGGRGPAAPDSAAIAAKRKQTVDMAKEIKVLGFKDITDTLISIYNEYSIKAGLSYDPLGNYGYEMAVPLKLLNLSIDDAKEFSYHIIVNGLPSPQGPGQGGRDGQQGNAGGGNAGGGNAGGGNAGGGNAGGGGGGGRGGGGRGGAGGGIPTPPVPGSARDPEMYAATDFWGKYTLAKK